MEDWYEGELEEALEERMWEVVQKGIKVEYEGMSETRA